MIDSLYALYSRRKEKPLDPNYKPEDAIRRRFLVNRNSDKLAVVFPGWHTHDFPSNVLAKRLVKRGWAVLYYDFHDQILEPDDEVVVESFSTARKAIVKELEALVREKHYEQIHFIGISMGNVMLSLVAKQFPQFSSATLVVAGDDLAVDMWHGARTSYLGDQFRKMHLGLRKLDEEWTALKPSTYTRCFRNKKVKFVMSQSDRFIMTKYQKKMLQRLKEDGAQVKVKKHWVGHAATIFLFAYLDSPL